MIVVKFGGTSVGDSDAIERAASIVRGRLPGRPVIVVSAMGGATNALLALAEQASRGHLIGAIRAVETLRERHLDAVAALVPDAQAASELSSDLGAMFDELARLAEAISVLGFLTPRSLDTIAAYGEILSSHLVTTAFRARDIPAELVDARKVMITDDRFCKAEPDAERIADAARAQLLPHLREGRVPVIGGFIGATPDGITTTLGRGGSDYSASLVGAALQADAIEIWTDVDGMLTADPRVVPDAKLIERIRFDEASELASFGAKVLHPSTIAPAVRRGIPVYIYNSRRPEGRGTLITSDAPRRPVSAIAAKSTTTVVKLRSTRMLLASGFMKTVFEIFEQHRTSVDVIATSEVSLSVTLDDPSNLDALLGDLTPLGDVSVERGRGIVSIVGAGLSDNGTALARAFGALGDLRVHMASLSATGINLTLVVEGEHVGTAMKRLHDAFFGGRLRVTGESLRVALIGMGKMGRTIDALAADRGAEIVARLDRDDRVDAESLRGADVAIEFSEPSAALPNVRACLAAGVPVVVGTTGWYDQLPAVERDVRDAGGRMLWAANYSLGVNAMIRLAAEAGRVLRDAGMDVHLVESHHNQKKDAPSGTAIAIARAAQATLGRDVPTTSIRVGHVPGTHTLLFDGAFEQLRIEHDARDRRVFAEGALAAARWLAARRESGVYTMSDVLAPANASGEDRS